MTDVWKSNARRFCEICKVWFADNRISIEHHEGGQKHKAAIQAKLRELSQQNKQKEKEQSDLRATLAMMESAASKSMGIDDSCPSAGIVGPMPKSKQYMDPRAHSASIAEMARHMAQQRKKELERTKIEHKTEEGKCDPKNETVWVEAKANNDALYYFHMYSGVTVWERPENYYTAEQYAMKFAMMENNNDAVDKSQITEPSKLQSELRRHWGQHETPRTSKSKISQSSFSQSKIEKTIPEECSAEKVPSNIQDPNTCQSTAVSEKRENSFNKPQIMKFDPEMDAANFIINECDIPLPPSSQNSKQEELILNLAMKEEVLEESNQIIQNVYSNTGGENTDVKNEIEEITEKIVKEKEPPRSGPYGPWTPVEKVPENPKVDWELPTEEQRRKRTNESVVAPEDLIIFSGKSAAVKRKKVDGPIEFRKRKTSIKIRQPIDD